MAATWGRRHRRGRVPGRQILHHPVRIQVGLLGLAASAGFRTAALRRIRPPCKKMGPFRAPSRHRAAE